MAVATAATGVEIRDLALSEVDDRLYRKLRLLTMGERGLMQRTLDRLRHTADARAIVAYNERGWVVSWVLLFQPHLSWEERHAYFFTRMRCRRQGYGLILGAYLQQHYRNATVCPWDDSSRAFFRQLSLPVASGYKMD